MAPVQVTALFWDNGGVILTNGWDRDARQRAAQKFQLDWTEFEDRHELVLDAFETGRITLDEYLRRTVFYRERGFSPDDFKAFIFTQSRPFPDALAFVARLRVSGRYLMAALSNESREIYEYRVRQFRLRECFQVFLTSCYLGVRKPSAEIYRLALEITQREPAECVLVDDRELNLECAREMGMHTIAYCGLAELESALAELGVSA